MTYYHHTGPMGEFMMVYNGADTPPEKMNIAVIGLGTGTMACYARPGQHLTFYDIDPVVKRLSFDEGESLSLFHLRPGCPRARGELDLVMGDARLTMEKKQLKDSDKYGIIVVDAFSSDAIPDPSDHPGSAGCLSRQADRRTACCVSTSRTVISIWARAVETWPRNAAWRRCIKPMTGEPLPGKTASTWVIFSPQDEYLKIYAKTEPLDEVVKMWRMELLPMSGLAGQRHGSGFAGGTVGSVLDHEVAKRPAKSELSRTRPGQTSESGRVDG